MRLKIGADPEFFLTVDGKPVSAHDVVPGEKHSPYPLEKGAVQADGTAVEFNIHPAETAEEFGNNISTVLRQIRNMVPARYEFNFSPSVVYEPVYFKRIPAMAKQFGCDPDYDAYSMQRNPKPKGMGSRRVAGGHIHIGWGDDYDVSNPVHVKDCVEAVKQLDKTLGHIEPAWCDDRDRRLAYGKLGSFRPKPYGVEYRVLSNSWLRYPALWPWLFKCVTQALADLAQGDGFTTFAQPSFEQFAFANTVLPFRYPKIPMLIKKEPRPWEFRF